jgi:hypothetical protein
LLGDYVIGPPPPQAQEEVDRLLAGERRRYALRAAVRAAGWLGPDHLASLAGLAVGDAAAADDEIESAALAHDAGEVPGATADGIVFSLSRLVAGDTGAVGFVEIGPEGIAWLSLVADELGAPAERSGGQVAWTDVLSALPPDETDLRTYLLAGGLAAPGSCDPAVTGGPLAGSKLASAAAAATGREAARLLRGMTSGVLAGWANPDGTGLARPQLAGPDIVLVRRTRRWPALEAAASHLREVLRPVAEIFAPGAEPLGSVVAGLVRRAPLRYDYCLMLAHVDQPTGRVHPVSNLLFPAGTTGQPHVIEARDVLLTAPPAAAEQLAVPVVARRGDNRAEWPVVGLCAMDGTFPAVTQLRIELDRPGQVSMTAMNGSPRLLPGDVTPGWPGVLGELPDQVAAVVVADVVLLVELGGDRETVARRMSLVDDLLGELDRPGITVGVVGYREHGDEYPKPGLLVRVEPGDAAGVRRQLARADLWQGVEVRDKHAAPLEDALQAITHPDWGWRSGARHLLVVLGARPPHPRRFDPRAEVLTSPCPWKLDSKKILARLEDEHGVKCIAVLPDEIPEDRWREITTTTFSYAERSLSDGIVRALGLGKENPGARVPLAMRAPDATRPGMRGNR